jgi:hypothetical protein
MITRLLTAAMALAIVAGGPPKGEPGKSVAQPANQEASGAAPDIAKQALNYCLENPKLCGDLARLGVSASLPAIQPATLSTSTKGLAEPQTVPGTFAPHLAKPPRRQSRSAGA